MRQLGLTKSHSFTKSAKVVGEVIGNYHPHGDSSVYDTMVRMAQDFAMRMPLIDGQGNFGSIDGDPAAAYRYTECRMERLAEELLADIDKDTVDMTPTFDETTVEPTVLPAKYPNLLVNGATGIGVGMATNIPPHNLGEVIDATIALIDTPTISILEMMEFIKGPDFPTGAIIRGLAEIHRLYHTGKGVVKIRSKAEVVEKDGKEQIIISEIPYAVNKENMVKKIADLVRDKRITGISGLRDETSRRVGIRIVIDIKRNSMASVVLNQLYAHTQLESGFACSLLVVDHNRPKTMNLKQILQAYVDHRLDVITRRIMFALKKAEARAHILDGLLIAVKNIDELVKIIRASRDKVTACNAVMERFKLTKIQASAILEMRLHQLTGLAIEDLQNEYDELMKHIDYLKSLLADRQLRLNVMKEELLEVKTKYNNPRRTAIEHSVDDFSIADLIERHACIVTVSNTGYIQRVHTDTFKTQHRGGKGVKGMNTKEEDHVEHLFVADSHDLIFFFTDKGSMYWLNVYEIPEGSRTSRGKAIINLIKVDPGEQVKAMLTVKSEDMTEDNLYITMSTKNGYIKKTLLSAFKNLRKGGIRAISIDESDDLMAVAITDGTYEILISSSQGMACRFLETQVRPMGRTARGVTAMRFKLKDDHLVSMLAVKSEVNNQNEDEEISTDADTETNVEIETEAEIVKTDSPQVLVISDGGMGKRSYINTYRMTKRGAKGVVSMRLNDKEQVISAIHVERGDEIIITTKGGQTVRIPTDELRTIGRASKGVRIMDLRGKNDSIVSVAKLMEIKFDDDENESVDDDDNQAEEEVVNNETVAEVTESKEDQTTEE